MKKKRRIFYLLVLCLTMLFSHVVTYATDTSGTQDKLETQDQDDFTNEQYGLDGENSEKKDEVTKMLQQMYTKDLYSNSNGLATGIAMAKPFVKIIYAFCIFLVIVVSYFFIGVTMTDLAFIIIPPIRGLLYKRTMNHGGPTSDTTGSLGNICCISDSCIAAVYGSSGGSGGSMGYSPMGGGGSDRGVGSSLAKYIGLRTKEFVVFIVFVLAFLTGLLGRLVVVIFNLFISLFEGVANFG